MGFIVNENKKLEICCWWKKESCLCSKSLKRGARGVAKSSFFIWKQKQTFDHKYNKSFQSEASNALCLFSRSSHHYFYRGQRNSIRKQHFIRIVQESSRSAIHIKELQGRNERKTRTRRTQPSKVILLLQPTLFLAPLDP